MTCEYVVLEVSRETYAGVRATLAKAGHEHSFHKEGKDEVIDMHGIALRSRPRPHERGDRVKCDECGRQDVSYRGYGRPSLCEECWVLREIRRVRASSQRSSARRDARDPKRSIPCPECPRRFRTKPGLETHYTAIHSPEVDQRDRELASQSRHHRLRYYG
ncbi:hypothetical protein LCGC14_2911210 [marine sediment metagenome]|uniref:C2H2-type domain-containing protein n=1 Tax=marine sediment metagenome TaxID=412755 RepID=A0A0F8ZZ73_9ZZZZ